MDSVHSYTVASDVDCYRIIFENANNKLCTIKLENDISYIMVLVP